MKAFKHIFLGFSFLLCANAFAFESYDMSHLGASDYEYGGGYADDNDDDELVLARNKYSRGNYDNDEPRYSQRKRAESKRNNRYYGMGKVFIFDPRALQWYAYYNGQLINSGSASGGKHYCPDVHRPCRTPVGVFSVYSKGGPDCKSSKYPVGKGNAPMPWCMFFHRGFAIHGSNDVPGYNASHGCIRVHPGAARWLSYNFLSHGTKVIVRGY